MSNLVACLDCGQLISSSAHVCPKCNTDHPRGVKCSVCGIGSLPKKDALCNRFLGDLLYYHPECVKRILDVPDNFLCADCGVRVNQIYDWEKIFYASNVYIHSCPNCGLPEFVRNKIENAHFGCGTCRLPLLGFHKVLTAGSGVHLKSYHDACAPESLRQREASGRKLQSETKPQESNIGCATLLLVILLTTLLFLLK